MKVSELKHLILDQMAQLIVFDRAGHLLESCHALVDLKAFIGSSLYERYPLLDSLKEVLQNLSSSSLPLSLPGVDFSFEGRWGYYDFELFVHPEHPNKLVWILLDNTALYRYFRPIQQERNEMLADQERLT